MWLNTKTFILEETQFYIPTWRKLLQIKFNILMQCSVDRMSELACVFVSADVNYQNYLLRLLENVLGAEVLC